MCGRYSLFTPRADLEERFGATFESSFEPTYNAAPGQELPVIRNDAPDTVQRLSWGFVPEWANDPDDRSKPINARAETVADKPTFREAYERRRCLVPADGFYEWSDRDGSKRPYRVAFEDDRPFAMAGVWEAWEGTRTQTALGDFGDGDEDRTRRIESFAVLTTEPNEVVGDLHHRMAVVLAPDAEERWLAGETVPDLFDPYPGDEMHAYPVSTRVNSPANDGPELIEPEDW
jgi:putative SOS response-associated peptidase YedK